MKKALKIGCGIVAAIVVIVIIGSVIGIATTENGDSTVKTESGEKAPAVEILQHKADYEKYSKSYTVHVRCKNNTENLIKYLQINVTFYDKEGNIVGTGIGNTTNFAAGKERTVDVIAMEIEGADNYELDIENIMY